MAQSPTIPALSHTLMESELVNEFIHFLKGKRNGVLPLRQVRAVAVTSLSLTAASTTLDGLTIVSGDRILLTAQSSSQQNGIYYATVTASTMALTRTDDYNESNCVTSGMIVAVGAGTTYGGTHWKMTTAAWPGTKTLDTDAQAWSQITTGATGATGTTGATGATGAMSGYGASGQTVITGITGIYVGTGLSCKLAGGVLSIYTA